MFNFIEEYLSGQEDAFAQLEDFVPRIEKIKEADKIGNEILGFINENVKNIDMDALMSLDIPQIIEESDLSINENLDGDILLKIYEEIGDTFKEGGLVSLEDYLLQGDVLMKDMLFELKGEVDYSIGYSQKQLKEAESKAFERFNLVLSMQNLEEIAFCFDLSEASNLFRNKCNTYLKFIKDFPIAKTIEEKIGELNNSILLVATLEHLGSTISNKVELNNFFSDKINDVFIELAQYKKDSNINNMFNELKITANNYSDMKVLEPLNEKLKEIDVKIFNAELEKDTSREL